MSAATTEIASSSPSTRKLADLPGPKQAWVFGNAFQLDARQMHLQLERWAKEFGTLYQLRIMQRPLLITSDVDVYDEVQRARPDTYRRVSLIETVFEELGLFGVFSAEGAEWRSQRRLAMEALATRHLRGFYPKLSKILDRLVERWQKAADGERVLDLATELKLFTVDVTTLLVFGHDSDTLSKQDGDEDVIQKHLEVFFPAFDRRLNAVVPYWRLFKLPQDYRLQRAVTGINTWIGKRIDAARARLAEGAASGEKPENFIESMLAARDGEGKPFSDVIIRGNALTMLLAGEDTTAYAIGWAIHHLIDEPVVREKLREEIARVLGDATAPPSLEAANGLVYAAGIANEALRLRSVVPLIYNEPLHDVVLGGIEVPRGATIIHLTRLPTLDDQHFKDAAAFMPERWISEQREGVHEASTFSPFGSGPRICPGRALALLEMKLAIATIYQRFDVERVGDASEVEEINSFTMKLHGLRVRVRRRA